MLLILRAACCTVMLELMLFVAFTIVLGFIIVAIFPIFQSILGSSVSSII